MMTDPYEQTRREARAWLDHIVTEVFANTADPRVRAHALAKRDEARVKLEAALAVAERHLSGATTH
jgi:hypothetical protein